VKAGAKKVFKRNKVEYEKLADHIGLYPVVFISPYDGDLIAEGSEMRRKWMDGIISQIDKKYLENLMNYNRVVEQRNALLKQIHLGNQNTSELEIWDAPMEQLGEKIYERRLVFVDSFIPIFEKYYQTIGAETETVQMVYRSDFGKGAFTSLLQSNLRKDLAYQYSTVGIHKDDLLFSLNGNPVKKYGSQGQQKSYVIALRLAQYEYIAEICNQKPVLLLDDIFDKLDSMRILKLIDLVSSDFFGQVIITDTESERLELIFKERNAEFRIFDIHSLPIPHE
jgi:DNA replication and repair protein RecF